MKIKSKALEVNIACYHVDVTIDAKYAVLQEIMSGYYGLMERLNTFLKELSHPYKDWNFIIHEARSYSLDYFYLLKNHPKGHEAAALFVNIFICALESCSKKAVQGDSIDNLLLFLKKIIKNSGSDIKRFIPVVNESFDYIRNYNDDIFFLFIKSFYQIKNLAKELLTNSSEINISYKYINLLLLKYFKHSYSYWLSEECPRSWFEKQADLTDNDLNLKEIFNEISHNQIKQWNLDLENIAREKEIDSEELLKSLLKMPGYKEIVEIYREIPQKLLKKAINASQGNKWKLLFLFHIMNTAGLSMIHKEALREINRTVSWLIEHEKSYNINKLIDKTFSILKTRTSKFPAVVLNCVLNMGKGVYKTDEIDLVNLFIDSTIDLGFQSPMIEGVGNNWQVKVNSAHIGNIKTWLELIELNPKLSVNLLSCLIIHLSVSGVFIKDTDLFPRNITKFLNSDIKPAYNLAKQLARLFPVYFNDIGAEGKLRDISTDIDELTSRKDVLVHFLRKQSHVESNNLITSFMEAIFNFWKKGEKNILKPFVPPDIYKQIAASGQYLDGIHLAMTKLEQKGLNLPADLITIKDEKIREIFADIKEVPQVDLERLELAISLYKLLNQKYNLDVVEMDHYIAQLKVEAFPHLDRLKKAFAEPDIKKKLSMLIDYLELLKDLILSHKSYEVREDIYKKRHITVDIPSMYGYYHELKFDALGLTFRIESLVNVLFEKLIQDIDLSLITRATFYQILDRLILFDKALKVNGISSVEMEHQINFLSHLLKTRGFTFTQYVDIFKGFTRAVKNIINDYFNNIHEENLTKILNQIPIDQILPKYFPKQGMADHEKLKHRVSEIFLRDKTSLSLGLGQLDIFLTRILNTLFHQADKLPKDKVHLLLNYDPKKAMTSIVDKKSKIFGIIHLGNKGFNIIKMKNYDLPVPAGFIITTEVFRCREIVDSYPPARQNFREQVAKNISALEKLKGKAFGDSTNPLLLSIRSGSSISQPGMLDTFLNVGINEEIVEGIAARTGNTWFAWDNYRRFLQCYGMSFDIERNVFDAIISDFKEKTGIPYKREFTGEQMRELALTYKKNINDADIDLVEEPLEQLHLIIKKVFDSWNALKARTYRKIMGISDDWGTAVTVQEMVFGNLSSSSGSGVIFTHNPRWPGDNLRLWGDFTLGNQGEDVVSGLVKTLPISINQQEIEMRETNITLETHFPEIYKALKKWANELIYKKGWTPQEIEFTFESPSIKDLYLLQTRDMAMRERKKSPTFDPEEINKAKYLGRGIGVSGGAMNGRVVFTLEDINKWRKSEPKTSLILVRGDTVPDDIREIDAADGLLTARGGLTSHAAVVAHRLGKTCVIGSGNLICNEEEKNCLFNQLLLKSGDYISIEGQEGSVYQGKVKVK
ncbi:MAG: pyruvate, phosphate dikinase [Deltaproteobacteria bacterium]|nr:pyruvate, phosphate dikinase [Deltaproteobacteria bacterium]